MEEFRKVGNEKKYEAGQILNATGRAYVLKNDYQMAEKTLREAREVLTNTVGEKNLYFLVNLYWVATNFYNQGRYSEAEVEVEKLRELLRDFYPNGHVQVGNADRLLGEIHTKTNRLKEGEEKLREAVEYVSKKVAEPNPQIAQAKAALGENLLLQKKYTEAAELLAAALDAYLKTSGEGHPFTKQCRELLNSVPK
jgi:tetratricopeptide (TPR) repeat protein